MKLLHALVPIAALWCAQSFAETPRLSLWITEKIGATDGRQCAQPALSNNMKLAMQRAKVAQRIDDSDVASWDPATATWALHDAGIPARDRAWQIADRCFILWIDGQPAAAGVALWTYSARLVHMPVLSVSAEGGVVSLRLGANQGDPSSMPVAYERIKEALKTKTIKR